MSSSRVPAARVVGPYLQPLLDACAAQGIERTRLATTAGLPAGLLLRPLDELPVAHYVQLLQAASVLAGDRGFGLRMAEFVRPGTYGVLGISLLSCATLGQALQQVLKYEALVHDLGTSQLQTLPEGVCRFVWLLRAALPEILTVAEVAARLHVSPRTLQRRLQEAGSHFLAELERVRRELAEDYVRHSALGITEIALLLGYREASSFSHAFRGWLGMSPQQFRRQR